MSIDIRGFSSGQAKTLGDEAYRVLRHEILSVRLAPDERLRFRPLVARLALGIPALREALSRLASERLVVLAPQRGFRVAPISVAELRDICQLRIELSVAALQSAIRLGDENWEAEILAALQRLIRTPLPTSRDDIQASDLWERRHEAFHDSLIAACNSPWRLHFCSALSSQFERYRRAIILNMARSDAAAAQVEEEHRGIAMAAVGRDSARACRLLTEHFEWSRNHFLAQYEVAATAA